MFAKVHGLKEGQQQRFDVLQQSVRTAQTQFAQQQLLIQVTAGRTVAIFHPIVFAESDHLSLQSLLKGEGKGGVEGDEGRGKGVS